MTQTVAAYDLERPAPQPSTTVASVAPPQNSDAGPRALMAAGQADKEIGDELGRFSLHLDTLQAQDALNQLRARKEDLAYGKDGFMNVKGGEVINPNRPGGPLLDDYKGRLQAATDDITSKLGPRARMMFEPHASAEMTAFKGELGRHSLHQVDVYQKSVFNSGNAQDTSEAIRYAQDPDMVAQIGERARVRAEKFAKSEGLDPGFFATTAQSNVIRAAIDSRAAQNDGPGAVALFRLFGTKLDAKDSIEVGRTIKTVEVGETARAYVGDLNVDETGRRDQVIKSFANPMDGAAFAGNFWHESRFRTASAINPGDGRDGSDSINMGQWNGPRAKAFKAYAAKEGLSESDPATAIKYAKAELYGDIPYSVSGVDPSVRARFEAAKTVEEKAAILSREFFKPRDVEGNASVRGQTGAKFLADYQKANDPLAGAANVQAPVPGAPAGEGPPGFRDTRQMLIDAEKWHIEASTRNQRDWANNPTQMAANKALIDVQFANSKAQIELAQHQLNKAVEDWVAKPVGVNPDGTPIRRTERPPPEIWNQLTFEKQRSVDATLAHNAKGTDAVTDQPTWYEIQRGLTSPDPRERQKWADYPLWEAKTKLSNSDFQELAKMQGAVRKGDPDKELSHVRGVNQMTDDALLKMKIDPTPKPGAADAMKAAAFRRAIQDDLTAFEQQKGHKATAEEVQKIIDRQVRQIGGTGGWFSSDKRRYELKITDVPETERAKITDALKRAGRPVNDQTVIDLFALKNGKPQ